MAVKSHVPDRHFKMRGGTLQLHHPMATPHFCIGYHNNQNETLCSTNGDQTHFQQLSMV